MDPDDALLQLYKLEYEKAAERYENIYRSIWTIFSYLTAVTAGLLAFGSDRINSDALICVAAIPLLFWFWTTYLPLDRYGHQALESLREIERILNARFHSQLNHFTAFAHSRGIFASMKSAPKGKRLRELRDQFRRARFSICFIFLLLHILVIYEGYEFRKSGSRLFVEKPGVEAPAGTPHNVTIVGSSK